MPTDICRDGHEPADITFQHNGPEISVYGHCRRCGFGLAASIQDNEWEVYGDSYLPEEEDEVLDE